MSYRAPASSEMLDPPSYADGAGAHQRIVLDHERELVWLFDGEGTVRYVTPLCAEMLGYEPGELVGGALLAHLHPDDVPGFLRFFREAWGGTSQGLAYRVRKKGGEYLWLGSTARAVPGEGGGVAQLQVVSRDVTQRKRTEEALQWLSRQTQLILDSAGEGIYGLDLAGRITFVNPAAARTLGYREGELIGRPHHSTFHHCREDGAAYPLEECPIHATLRDGTPRRVDDEVFCRSDGSRIPVEYTATPALEGEKIVGAVVTFRDITARKEAEASLRRAEWLAGIGQTVLTLRHEINNPLTSMLADAALLEMEGNTPEEEREMVCSIIRQARRIRDVVHRLTEVRAAPAVREVGSARMLDLSAPGEEPA